MNGAAIDLKRFIRGQKLPIAGVHVFPLMDYALHIRIWVHVQISAINYTILILDEKGANFLSIAKLEIFHTSSGIDGEVGISIQMPSQAIKVLLHAAEVNAHHT